MSTPCPESRCTGEAGHLPPHGIYLHELQTRSGLVFAPFSGTQAGPERQTDLVCNSCKRECMMMRLFKEGGGSFTCRCGQNVRILAELHSQTKITLWSEHPTRKQQMAYAEWWVSDKRFFVHARVLCGLITDKESTVLYHDIDDEALKYKRAIPVEWWRRILTWVRR